MDHTSFTADKHRYPPPLLWSRSASSPAVPRLKSTLASSIVSAPVEPPSHSLLPTHIDLLPVLLPPQPSRYHAELVHYNRLVSAARGRGGGLHLQTPPLPPLLSTSHIHARTPTGSPANVPSKDSNRAKPGTQTCHGNRGEHNTNKGDRAHITRVGRDPISAKMLPSKKPPGDLPTPVQPRPGAISTSTASLMTNNQQPHSSSVPSTPHQRARKFSFESREPSPNANPAHSPRSAYSETNSNGPSLRPLPPRTGGCQFETALERPRRRMPYNLGGDRLEKSDLTQITSKLAEDDERKLTTDMRELYDRLKPTDAVERKRGMLVQKLEKLLNDAWPGHDIRVNLFGSSGNLLCSDDSDVDICITTQWKRLEGVCMLAELLAKHGMEKVVCVSSAKVPIVKIWDPELKLACDMNVNNTLALENTRMIRTYVEIDDRIRPLAMIIKHWTRRRIINDAAFGGTLSSYTWICMIIAFLQLRQPAIVPALHQRALNSNKTEGENGHSTNFAMFADDLDNLSGYGSKNKSTLGELLFEFFRFYAHEFDYANLALSVRLGKVMKKTERAQWVLASNSQLCVEEPFNTARNLGNTADDTSFRGIHLELRRAFDLIAAGDLDECCRQYVYPKEEAPPIFQKPSQTPRPVLMRSASQQHNGNRGGRGGRDGNSRGNRHQGSMRNNNNHGNNRRASSSTHYDNPTSSNGQAFFHGWPYMASQDAMYMQPDALAQTLSALQLQENNLRFLQFTQSQAYAQHQALAHAHRLQSGNTSQPQSSTGRSRTSSFDTPPMSAPLRPDMFYYMQYPNHAYYAHPGLTSYPSSPSAQQAEEPRRSTHRSSATSDAGATSGSSLRSHSQPASRPFSVMKQAPPFPEASYAANGLVGVPARRVNGVPLPTGVPIPSFIPDEGTDNEHEGTTHTPPGEDKYLGRGLVTPSPGRRTHGITNGALAFGDIGSQSSSQPRRRLSSDQFPQFLDRIKHTSRSPSPLGRQRGLGAASSTPLTSVPVPQGQDTTPLVVNGSAFKPTSMNSSRQLQASSEDHALEDPLYENPLRMGQGSSGPPSRADPTSPQVVNRSEPVIVNGSSAAAPASLASPTAVSHASINDPFIMPHGVLPNGTMPQTTIHGTIPSGAMPNGALPNGNSTLTQLPQAVPASAASNAFAGFRPAQMHNPVIAQLDLARGDPVQTNDPQNLSPVYENRTPSPTATRKFDLPAGQNRARSTLSKDPKPETVKAKSKTPTGTPPHKKEAAPLASQKLNGVPRDNGPARSAKAENETNGPGAWQKMTKGRKKGDGKGKSEVFSQSEQLPKNDFDRKGG